MGDEDKRAFQETQKELGEALSIYRFLASKGIKTLAAVKKLFASLF